MTLPFYPFYWGDYSAKTFDLTLSQHGVYFLLLRHVYCTGQTIPHDSRFVVAKAKTRQEKQDVDIILENYFERAGDFWLHARADEIMKEADERHQLFVESGKRGGRPPSKAPLKPPFSTEKAPPKQPELQPEPIEESKSPLPPIYGGVEVKKGFENGRRRNQRYSNRDSVQQAIEYIEAREQRSLEEGGQDDLKLLP